ncbi:DUF2062 domain-containing protein [Atopomonas sediminilitoris]|uniref:DUF2062 domain-containing protein n=1 Tax=Atopomonas sediminilitoris TaxID=2919919 RepID=UPI001F4D60AA|nr:DUF2062 domain-containing protein [Atopomonas sediminilitoris]MCJ8169116.1 DUF2062 domain-containing protein [Atopomonas sediminilitoris]
MPRRIIKRYLPNPDAIKSNKSLRFLGKAIHDPNLWHLNRHSVARAMAIGLFWAMIPMPMQMAVAAVFALFFRANLPISAALVWLTNPLTMPPIFYCSYKAGAWLLDTPPLVFPDELDWAWFEKIFSEQWQPLYLGSAAIGIALAILGYFAVQVFWRWWVGTNWKKRKARRLLKKNN